MTKKYCCDMRGMLSFLILFLLSKKKMHGQEIADELERRKGSRPSPGTIYPALKILKDQGLLQETRSGKTIEYEITTEGRSVLAEAKKQFCRAFTDIF